MLSRWSKSWIEWRREEELLVQKCLNIPDAMALTTSKKAEAFFVSKCLVSCHGLRWIERKLPKRKVTFFLLRFFVKPATTIALQSCHRHWGFFFSPLLTIILQQQIALSGKCLARGRKLVIIANRCFCHSSNFYLHNDQNYLLFRVAGNHFYSLWFVSDGCFLFENSRMMK